VSDSVSPHADGAQVPPDNPLSLTHTQIKEAIKEESNAECEESKDDAMRRLPTQGKEKCGSPRVTLRIHQLKEKKEKAKGGLAAPDHDTYSGMEGKPGSEEVVGAPKESAGEEAADASETKENVPEHPGNEAQETEPTAQVKRTHSTEEEEDTRKKRRKEDNSRGTQLKIVIRGKSGSNSGGSPKSVVGGESEGEDNKSVGSPGPKVPPLKIVISGANLEEQGTRNGKNGSGRHHLPYVVASSTEGEGSPPAQPQDSETTSSNQTEEQRSHQRVLRSHRSGNGGSGSSGASGNPSPLAPSGNEAGSPRQVSPTPVADQGTPLEVEEKPAVMSDAPESPRQTVELHPRKRKLKPKEQPPPDPPEPPTTQSHPTHEQQVTNSYQLFLNIRKQIDQKRKGLFPVQPKPPQGFKDYLMNRCTYVLAGNSNNRIPPASTSPPTSLPAGIRDLYIAQEKERHRLLMQHVIEKEKLVLSVEQEILRVHGRAARALANQSLPFSVCTILRDEEVYSAITPEQEEKDRIARSRYNGRLFISWLRDVDDKWEKIKEAMLLRHHNEAESLHAVQKMDWEWKMKELGICEFKSKPVIDDTHVPMVHVSDDFDLLPA